MRIRWHWGTAIALVYTLFAAGTVTLVAYAMGHRVDLVSPDYYAQSLEVDARQQARARADRLTGLEITTSPDEREVVVTWPRDQRASVRGTAVLYRAAASRDDRTVALAPDASGRQTFSLAGLPPGRWVLHLSWSVGSEAYYLEQALSAR